MFKVSHNILQCTAVRCRCVICMCVWNREELAIDFQSLLNDCPSNMAKRWIVLQVIALLGFSSVIWGALYFVFCHNCSHLQLQPRNISECLSFLLQFIYLTRWFSMWLQDCWACSVIFRLYPQAKYYTDLCKALILKLDRRFKIPGHLWVQWLWDGDEHPNCYHSSDSSLYLFPKTARLL